MSPNVRGLEQQWPAPRRLALRYVRVLGGMAWSAKTGVTLDNTNHKNTDIDKIGHKYIWCKRFRCPRPDESFTFLGYDPEVLDLLPAVVRKQLPCRITRRSAIDNKLLALLRRLAQTNYSFEQIAALGEGLNVFSFHLREEMYIEFIKATNERRTQGHRVRGGR